MEQEYSIITSIKEWWRLLRKKSKLTLSKHSKDLWLTNLKRNKLSRLNKYITILLVMVVELSLLLELDTSAVSVMTLTYVISVKLKRPILILFLKLENLVKHQILFNALISTQKSLSRDLKWERAICAEEKKQRRR